VATHPSIVGFVYSLNETLKDIDKYGNLSENSGLPEFVGLGGNYLEWAKTLVEAIQGMRIGKPNSPSSLVEVLNNSPENVPRFKVEEQQVKTVRIGSLCLQAALVLNLKGRDKFNWKLLKRCNECNNFLYGGGKRKIYCKKDCERRSNNRYKQERDKIRSAYYRYNVRRAEKGKRKESLRKFKEEIYKPR